MVLAPEMIDTRSRVAFGNRLLVLVSAPLLRHSASSSYSYEPVQQLAVQEEVTAIADALESSGSPISLDIKVVIATVDSIRRAFSAKSPPAIIHFIGHGVSENDRYALLLEDEFGLARPLDVYELKMLFKLYNTPPCQLAVLNACYSEGFASALLEAGVRHVIAVNATDTILDVTSRCFSKYLYPTLLLGSNVIDAFDFAKNAIVTDDRLAATINPQTFLPANWDESLKLRLLPANSTRHHQPLDLEDTLGKIHQPLWENTNITPISVDPFVGRRFDIYQIAQLLRSTTEARCVLLQGIGGMGKTALSIEVGRWHHERSRWLDGVWLINLRNITTISQARAQIAAILDFPNHTAWSNDTLINQLNNMHMLLILDDMDMLLQLELDDTVNFLQSLLSCKRLRLLVTSRHDLSGRIFYKTYTLGRMEGGDALVAFQMYAPPLERWGVTDTYHDDIQSLMDFLDGYPFPIRLAATYMKQARCSLRSLNERLTSNPMGTLRYQGEEESRDTSLLASLNLSYSALPPGARDIFSTLSLFPAGLTERAALGIIGSTSIESLETLLQFSMAEERERIPARRFALPEPARRYSETHLKPNSMSQYAPKALTYYYEYIKSIASAADEQSRISIILEQPNLLHFLNWGYEHEVCRDNVSRSARITALLSGYWNLTMASEEQSGMDDLNSALLAATRANDKLGQAHVHKVIGEIYHSNNETRNALTSYESALNVFKEGGYELFQAQVYEAIGEILLNERLINEALDNYEQAYEHFRRIINSPKELFRNLDFQYVLDPSQESDIYNRALSTFQEEIQKADRYKAVSELLKSRMKTGVAIKCYKKALEIYVRIINFIVSHAV